MSQLFKAKTAWFKNSAIAPSCLSFRLFAQKYTHPVAVERTFQLSLQRSITRVLVPWLVPKTSFQARTIHQRCVGVSKMLSMSVSCIENFQPLPETDYSIAGLFAPRAGQNFRDEQRRRRSQYDRGTRLAEIEDSYETRHQDYRSQPNSFNAVSPYERSRGSCYPGYGGTSF